MLFLLVRARRSSAVGDLKWSLCVSFIESNEQNNQMNQFAPTRREIGPGTCFFSDPMDLGLLCLSVAQPYLGEHTTMVGHGWFSRINGTSRSVAGVEDNCACMHGVRATEEYIVNPGRL